MRTRSSWRRVGSGTTAPTRTRATVSTPSSTGRGRGNRAGRKVKEEGGAIKENEKIKILTKEQPGKENHGEDEEVDVVVES